MEVDYGSTVALASTESVKRFSSLLLELVGDLQSALQRLSEVDRSFTSSGYAILMEVYGLRTRSYILLNDPASHVVSSLSFTQQDLLDLVGRLKGMARNADDLKVVNAIVLSIATFTVALGDGRDSVVNFLFDSLRCDVSAWEGSLR